MQGSPPAQKLAATTSRRLAVAVAVLLAGPALLLADTPGNADLRLAHSRLPLSFEQNEGQTDPQVAFLARGAGSTLFLTRREAVLKLGAPGREPDVLRLRLAGGRRSPRVVGLDPQATRSSYLLGRDPSRWRPGVAHFGRVRYEQVYPGIDLVYYGRESQLEFDFVVKPGADPHRIQLDFQGAERLEIGGDGDLLVHLRGGLLRQHKPVVYQERDGRREPVAGAYVAAGRHRVAFQLGDYDPARPLVIDPVLAYSTYLGGSGTEFYGAVTVSAAGQPYVVATTLSSDFPTASPLQASQAGNADVVVARLDAAGSALVYSTYLGGSGDDFAHAVALDSAGNAYVVGRTTSANFPTASPLQATRSGTADAFVAKLSPDGQSLVYSTYLGGSGVERAGAVAVDSPGNAYVAGSTSSTNWPTANPLQAANAGGDDAFIAKLNATGSALVYSTYLGGTGTEEVVDLALNGAGEVFVAGSTSSTDFPTFAALQGSFGGGAWDAFVAKLDATGAALSYSTYLGGTDQDVAGGLALDGAGSVYVSGSTKSADFPVAASFQPAYAGAQDAFLTKLGPAGSTLVYSTYLGGSLGDGGGGVRVDGAGNAYLAGVTVSTDFPVAGSIQAYAGLGDYFVAKLNAAGTGLVYSTYLGGSDSDEYPALALAGPGRAWLTGMVSSTDFPTAQPLQASNAGPYDLILSRLQERPAQRDFDLDSRSDLAVLHEASGLWFLRSSSTGGSTGFGFGGAGYVPVVGDYDGDLRSDVAMYHPPSGLWFFRDHQTGAVTAQGWGGSDYAAVPGDYDGDGKTDVAAFHTALGLWFIRQSSQGGALLSYDFGGGGGYTVVPRDYDGDGKTDLAVYNASTGLWYVRSSSTGTTSATGFGGTAYRPVPGDYDGDGKADLAVYHTSLGIWFVKNSSTGTVTSVDFGGGPGYTPVPGHFDADPKLDLALYSETTGLWFWKLSSSGAVFSQGYGGPGYKPVLP